MVGNLAFVDTETTGLDPERHEVWDIALIVDDDEVEFHLRPKFPAVADPNALRLTNFYARTGAYEFKWNGDRDYVAARVAALTAGRHLVGAVPWFDAAFLSRFLIHNGQREAWHYHMIDVETLAIGYLRGRQRRAGRGSTTLIEPPWDSHALSDALGIDSSSFGERHTAIADARWARAIYEKVMGR